MRSILKYFEVAVGVCLVQEDESINAHAVAYYSRKFREAETWYSATDSEALAVTEAVRAFDPYMYSRHFTVFTDHHPALLHIFRIKSKSIMSRWCVEFHHYDFQIVYRRDTDQQVPDMLSIVAAIASVEIQSLLRPEQN